jgi:hypothetical protein
MASRHPLILSISVGRAEGCHQYAYVLDSSSERLLLSLPSPTFHFILISPPCPSTLQVIPPAGWAAHQGPFPSLQDIDVKTPIRQNVFGGKGAYRYARGKHLIPVE